MDFYFKLLERTATKNTPFINAEKNDEVTTRNIILGQDIVVKELFYLLVLCSCPVSPPNSHLDLSLYTSEHRRRGSIPLSVHEKNRWKLPY